MDHVMTATDSACVFLRIRRNTKHKPVHLLILPNCVLHKKTKKKRAKSSQKIIFVLFNVGNWLTFHLLLFLSNVAEFC